jgi:hypothetical protein
MDTEGTENDVLEGAEKVLSKHRPLIMCEIIKGFIEREMETILRKYNYHFYEISSLGLRKVDRLVVEKGKLDYFFVPEERINEVECFVKQ